MIVPVGCMNPPTFYVNHNKTVYLSLATVVSAYHRVIKLFYLTYLLKITNMRV